ncbi:hypothetical protein ACFV4F_22635 [Kitasatospora sp. NPDC059722]|uniref:hypothetical protein n=1 Tax=Kitasatospora sp. NPDC059722 TaxID=3346925 RepID=UPI0036A17578
MCAITLLAALSAALTAVRSSRADAEALLAGQVLLSTDGRTLTAPVMWAPCQEAKPRVFARETSQTVAADEKRGNTADLTHECATVGFQSSFTLRAPLGDRRLTEFNTGLPFLPFPAARLADIGYLPRGFTTTQDVPLDFGPAGGSWKPWPFTRNDTIASWTRYYAAADKPALSITQVLTPAGSPGPAPATHAGPPLSVNGHDVSLLCDTDTERAITWSDGISAFTVMSYDRAHAALSTEELLRVAGGVHEP